MNLHFYKYQATGNDFILISADEQKFDEKNYEYIKFLCDRHFGIGADGLIILKKHPTYDFEMLYYNSDGLPATMCGNGGRCVVSFAHKLQYINSKCTFWASDGLHDAIVETENVIKLKISDVNKIIIHSDGYEIDTGSPHFIKEIHDSINSIDVFNNGRAIRNENRFSPKGVNVNFVKLINDNSLEIRTYERGVEAETLSCGTGSVAAAIYSVLNKPDGNYAIRIKAPGGTLTVFLEKKGQTFTNIWLQGEATFVFEGFIHDKNKL